MPDTSRRSSVLARRSRRSYLTPVNYQSLSIVTKQKICKYLVKLFLSLYWKKKKSGASSQIKLLVKISKTIINLV